MPASSPFTGAEVRFCRSMRWISWLRYQPYPAAAPAISTRTSASVPPTQAAVRLRERRFGAAWAGPWRPSSPSARLAPSGVRRPPVRLVDLAPELVQALLDRVLGRALAASGPCQVASPPRRSVGRAGGGPSGRDRSRDWEDSSRSVQIEDVRPDAPANARAPEMAPVWAAGTRRQPSERRSRPGSHASRGDAR